MPRSRPPTSCESTLRALEEAIASPGHLSARQMRDLLMRARDALSAPPPTQADEERARAWLHEHWIMTVLPDDGDMLSTLASEFSAARNEGAEAERERVGRIYDEAWASKKLTPATRMALAVVAGRVRDPSYEPPPSAQPATREREAERAIVTTPEPGMPPRELPATREREAECNMCGGRGLVCEHGARADECGDCGVGATIEYPCPRCGAGGG